MLQPLQLQEVSRQYAVEIGELRDFLTKAGLPVESPASMASTADRVYAEKAFRRDLTAHLWVAIDRRKGKASSSDLLGMLAIAAAGPRFAAEAEERDAHDLLRFVMDVQRGLEALDQPVSASTAAPVSNPVLRPAIVPASTGPGSDANNLRIAPEPVPEKLSEPAALKAEVEPGRDRRRPALWTAIALCVLAVLVTGLWWVQRQRTRDGNSAAVVSPAAKITPTLAPQPSPDASSTRDEVIVANPPAPEVLPEQRSPAAQPSSLGHATMPRTSHAGTAPKPAAGRDITPPTLPSIRSRSAAVTPTVVSPPAPMVPATPAVSASAPVIRSNPAPAPVSVGPKGTANPIPKVRPVLPALPTYVAQFGDDTPHAKSSQKYPELHRRRPADGADLVAETKPGEAPPRPGSNVASNSSVTGIVRPTSLGTMAGNVIYSPAPPYPAAASAAHVQGEVKIRIEVDRDGSVASASVISGPALLRDAALYAVQHWRYRPYLAGGRPVSTSAIAVLEFELP